VGARLVGTGGGGLLSTVAKDGLEGSFFKLGEFDGTGGGASLRTGG